MEKKNTNSLDFLYKALYNIKNNRSIKNRLSCKYCPFYETEHCSWGFNGKENQGSDFVRPPISPSGVGTQTKYFIEALIKTGMFQFVYLGGAIKHQDYSAQKIAPFEDDWTVIPIDGYGDAQKIRSIIRNEKPDILWFMTDPRFYEWLWFIENEIRSVMPMVYYHVWDNHPAQSLIDHSIYLTI